MKLPEFGAVYKKVSVLTLTWALFAVVLCCAPALPAYTTPNSDTWMTVLLDGRKIGHAHFTRTQATDKVTTRQKLHLEIHRDSSPLVIETQETDTESVTGEPLEFSSITSLSGSQTTVVGTRRADGRFDIIRSVGGKDNTSTIARPPGALLAEGQRLAALRAGPTKGASFDFPIWDVNSGKALAAHNTVIGEQNVNLPGGSQNLLRIDQRTDLPIGSIETSLWLDANYHSRKIRTSMLGMELELQACDKACAMAPNQGVDLLDKAMVQVPRHLNEQERKEPLTYTFKASGDKPLQFARTDEQQVAHTAGSTWRVTVSSTPQSREDPPGPADTQANDWLQSDNRQLRQLARKASSGAHSDAERMRILQRYVSRYITSKNLDVGYASALEVMRDRQGDCTEHAVFLAALGRAIGIPTRVVTGLAYAPHYAGRDNVLVPHAWVQSWVGDHWRSFDAALRGFDTGHIALETGDGDPWHFFSAVNTLGRIGVTSVDSNTH